MKRLILSQIPDDFNRNQDILLGPWCILGKEEYFQSWEDFNYEPDVFDKPEAMANAAKITSSFAINLIPKLAAKLNQINNTNYSNIFWRVMLLPWLIQLIQTTYEKQARILNVVAKYKEQNVNVELLNDNIEFEFKDTVDFMSSGLSNHLYNHWIFSRILENILPETWCPLYKNSPMPDNRLQPAKKSWKYMLYNSYYNPFTNLRCKSVNGIGEIGNLVWTLYLNIKPKRNTGLQTYSEPNQINADIKWYVDIEKVIEKTLPICFKDIKNITKKLYKPTANRLRLKGTVIYYDETDKYRTALCLEKGESIITSQHGGNYGVLKAVLSAEIEYVHHAFISWGWSKQEDYKGNIIPLPSPLLSKFANKHRCVNNNLIYVTNISRLYPLRLMSIPKPLDLIKERKNKTVFLRSLKQNIFNSSLYRPFPNELNALKDTNYIRKKFSQLQFCEGKLHPYILKCKLLVLDHPETTLNIAMAANIPLVGFWDDSAWVFCRQALPYFESLKEAGVIFKTGQEAAEKVNEIWDDVEGWWNQEQVQTARKNWCYQYARTNKFWWWKWIKAIWKI